MIDVRLPIPEDSYSHIFSDIVRENTPLLIGLDDIDEYQLDVGKIQNLLIHYNISMERITSASGWSHVLCEGGLNLVHLTGTYKESQRILPSYGGETAQLDQKCRTQARYPGSK